MQANRSPLKPSDYSQVPRWTAVTLSRTAPDSKKPKLKPQCVGLVEDTVKWMIESRMFDYGDETQWRERAHLPPLPPIPEPSDVQTPPGIHGNSNDSGGAPGSVVGVGGDSRKRANTSRGSSFSAASEVINLMSDSDDD